VKENWLHNDSLPLLIGTVLFFILCLFIISFVILYKKAQLRFELEKQQLRQILLQSEIEIKEETLLNVSRELHDNYGQIASLIKINLSMISKDLLNKDLLKVSESIVLTKQLINDIKSLSSSLNGGNIKKIGLLRMVENEVEKINRMGRVVLLFEHEYDLFLLNDEQAVILYRIIQEIFNNMLKHAEAKNSSLSLSSSSKRVLLNYKDNGIGFNKELLNENTRSGLSNIQERSILMGAKFELNSTIGQGTEIIIRIERQ
jgi:signal transduction histidine kinase